MKTWLSILVTASNFPGGSFSYPYKALKSSPLIVKNNNYYEYIRLCYYRNCEDTQIIEISKLLSIDYAKNTIVSKNIPKEIISKFGFPISLNNTYNHEYDFTQEELSEFYELEQQFYIYSDFTLKGLNDGNLTTDIARCYLKVAKEYLNESIFNTFITLFPDAYYEIVACAKM